MYKFIASAGLALSLMAGTLGAAQAGEVQNRINHQQARIHQGHESGQLTRGESMRDERRLHRVERERNHMLAEDEREGRGLTPRQKARLNRQLNENSGEIYRTKHNDRHRPGASTL